MSTETYSTAITNALNEIKSVCPDISHAFIFKENGKIIAEDQDTNVSTVFSAQEAFRPLIERASAIEGLESVTFVGAQARINFSRFEDFFITNVASNEVDEKTVANITRVMMPTVLKLAQGPTSHAPIDLPQETSPKTTETTVEAEPEPPTTPEIFTPQPQASHFTVENLRFGSALTDRDAVHLDIALIAQWQEMFGETKVTQVALENPVTGKTMNCPFKPMKDEKLFGKGLVQLPEKTQVAMELKKGSQVLIKPVFENQSSTPDAPRELKIDKEEADPNPEAKPVITTELNSDGPPSQFIVENLHGFSGLLGDPDFVRVSSALINRWKELFGDKYIREVIVEETITGKKIRAKVQTIRDSDLEGKGIIQIPEKIQQDLRTRKGALVVVKPVIEEVRNE